MFGLFVELEFLFPTILPKRDAVAEFYWLDGQVNAIDFVRLDEHPIDFCAADDRNVAAFDLPKSLWMPRIIMSLINSAGFLSVVSRFLPSYFLERRVNNIQTAWQRFRLLAIFCERLKSL